MINLTTGMISRDIEKFNERISKAQKQLEELPTGFLPFKDHKTREKQRRECESEVRHVRQLIRYASTGLDLLKQEREVD